MDCVNEDSKANLAALLGSKKPVAEAHDTVTDEELQEMK